MKTKQTLSVTVQRMLLHAVKSHGVEDALMSIEESLTGDEYDAVESFLKWLTAKGRNFGWNIAEVVADWENDQ